MSFDEGADYDPEEIEKYIISNTEFFKRWTLNNITLNQLNGILIEQQMMPATATHGSCSVPRVGFSISEHSGKSDELETGSTQTDASLTVICYHTSCQ